MEPGNKDKFDAIGEKALLDVKDERARQITGEDWSRDHDDSHDHGALALAAACYAAGKAMPMRIVEIGAARAPSVRMKIPKIWPWDSGSWKPKSRRRDLVRAGALILAEIERLDRADILSRDADGRGRR